MLNDDEQLPVADNSRVKKQSTSSVDSPTIVTILPNPNSELSDQSYQTDRAGVRMFFYPSSALVLKRDLIQFFENGDIIVDESCNPVFTNWYNQMLAEHVEATNNTVATPVAPPAIDVVNSPPHYQLIGLGIEFLDVRRALCASIPPGVNYYAVTSWSESITYLARMWGKNGLEDAKKARVYLDELIKTLES